MRVLVPFGTRPEIVKLAPVIRELRERGWDVRTLATGQHYERALTEVFYEELGFRPDVVWRLEGTDAERVGGLLSNAYRELARTPVDLVLVLGDTYTVPLFCLAARHSRTPVVHLEAGLRSFNETSSEETNRRIAAATASLHLAPTPLAADFLGREGVERDRIRVVGNTVVDAVRAAGVRRVPTERRAGVLFTAHRPTNVDDPERLGRLVQLLVRLAARVGKVTFPVHHRTRRRLADAGAFGRLAAAGVHVCSPLPYTELLEVLAGSLVVVTDSGGLQEEAAWLGVPAVVLRRSTPRWESVLAGVAELVGLDVELAVDAVERFSSPAEQARVAAAPCPYGDGMAAARIADVLTAPETGPLLAIEEPDFVGARPPGAVSAVLVDLDDTLYEQASWLGGAWRAVSAVGSRFGLDDRAFRRALERVAAEGSARGGIIDRALDALGAEGVPLEPLVDAFRVYEAERLSVYPGVEEALARLRARVPVALVTDGDPRLQRGKLRALGLDKAFDAVVLTDELGRGYRKPHPAPFHAALDKLGVTAADAVYIGDNPGKDVVGAAAAGIRVVRVRTGEYRSSPSGVLAWREVDSFAAAVEAVEPLLWAATRPRRRCAGAGQSAGEPVRAAHQLAYSTV